MSKVRTVKAAKGGFRKQKRKVRSTGVSLERLRRTLLPRGSVALNEVAHEVSAARNALEGLIDQQLLLGDILRQEG